MNYFKILPNLVHLVQQLMCGRLCVQPGFMNLQFSLIFFPFFSFGLFFFMDLSSMRLSPLYLSLLLLFHQSLLLHLFLLLFLLILLKCICFFPLPLFFLHFEHLLFQLNKRLIVVFSDNICQIISKFAAGMITIWYLIWANYFLKFGDAYLCHLINNFMPTLNYCLNKTTHRFDSGLTININ